MDRGVSPQQPAAAGNHSAIFHRGSEPSRTKNFPPRKSKPERGRPDFAPGCQPTAGQPSAATQIFLRDVNLARPPRFFLREVSQPPASLARPPRFSPGMSTSRDHPDFSSGKSANRRPASPDCPIFSAGSQPRPTAQFFSAGSQPRATTQNFPPGSQPRPTTQVVPPGSQPRPTTQVVPPGCRPTASRRRSTTQFFSAEGQPTASQLRPPTSIPSTQ